MAESVIQKGSGGAASDECTAGKAQVLAGYTAVTKDSGDEPVAGTMAANGNMTAALNCGQSKVIPAGYTPGGTVTANSLASQTGGVTAEDKYVLNGKTYWRDGVKRTGSMTVASVASFSVAPYSTSQVLATWKNPGRGPYSGIIICAKTGGYPANINDSRVYTGVGSNSAVNGTSSQVIGGLAAGTTYYFRIWVYCTCSAGNQYSGYLQVTCAPTAHGRAAFTASGTWTVPANVRSINVHCTGGGGGGSRGPNSNVAGTHGSGGAGGYTAYKNNISVIPGQQYSVVVGAGGLGDRPGGSVSVTKGAASSFGNIIFANGGDGGWSGGSGFENVARGRGGSGGGLSAYAGANYSGNGGSDGGSGYDATSDGSKVLYPAYLSACHGQGTTTREFGTGTLYSGGGGGGTGYYNYAEKFRSYGGAGGGGNGPYDNVLAASGTNGTGGGGGGGGTSKVSTVGGAGGSGNVIITW